MARGLKVSPPFKPPTPCDDEDEDDYEEEDDIASLNKKDEMVFHALPKGSNACSIFFEILTIAIESKKIIGELEARDEEQDETIEKLESLTNDLSLNFEEAQTTK